ncbi:MAG: hypothetical protein RRC34_11870 [Lentisphaeria bacterium]|nr:hypothetical protein [Lentisphaeria bacterium]
MPPDTPATLKQQGFSASLLGLAAILFGYTGLVATAAGEVFSPGPVAGLSFIATTVPLVFLFSGACALAPPDQTPTGLQVVWQIRFLAVGALFLFPFVSWTLSASRNSYLAACAFLALLCLSLLLQRLCEYLRLLHAARHAHVKSAWAYQIKQVAHFCLVTPCAVAAVIIFTRQKSYDIKASHLVEIIWRNASLPVKITVTAIVSLTFCAVSGLILNSLFSLPPRSTGNPEPPDAS